MDRDSIINEINELIKGGNDVLKTKWNVNGIAGCPTYVDSSSYLDWFTKTKFLLGKCLCHDNDFYNNVCDLANYTVINTQSIIKMLSSILDYEEKGIIAFNNSDNTTMSIGILYSILERFHDIVKQLRKRYNNRSTLDVADEYDVQDLLHCLLKIFYDDIRKEEWTPSYAGKCSRQDFLIKKEKCVIETKKTRQSLTEKELGDELLIDIARYKSHPDCSSLVCFIYDPDSRISNPIGFIDDLEKTNNSFVKIIINPI